MGTRFDDEIVHELCRFHNVMERINKIPREYAKGEILNGSEAHVIEHIAETKESYISELAAGMGITRSAASQMVAKLEKKGLLIKFRKPNIKRELFVKLTEAGEKVYWGHKTLHSAAPFQCFEDDSEFSEHDRERVLRFVVSITNDLIAQYLS